MINNIGLEGGTHYSTNLTMLPKGVRKIFEMKRFEIQFPLKHPKYVIENLFYKDAVDKILARNKRMIQKEYADTWEFVGIFADTKSGASIDKRGES